MKNLTAFFCIITLLFSFTTCSDNDSDDNCDDVLWDFANYEIYMTAIDADGGRNLFDPNNPNNLLDGGVWITYKDKRYDIVDKDFPNKPNTKATYVRPLALRHYPLKTGGQPGYPADMGFGEFAPGSYKNEIFTIHWSDGTTDEVKFDCYITWDKCDPTIHKALYLNGKQLSDKHYPTLSFVKGGKKTTHAQ